MKIDHNNFKSFVWKTSILLLILGAASLICDFIFASFFVTIILAAMFLVCIFTLCALFIYSVYFAYKRRIRKRDFIKIALLLIMTGYIGVKIMFYGNNLGSKAKFILVNRTGSRIEALKIGKAAGINIGFIAEDKWKFALVDLYSDCEIPLEYILKGKVKREIVCGCHGMLIGEFRKYVITGDAHENSCYEH